MPDTSFLLCLLVRPLVILLYFGGNSLDKYDANSELEKAVNKRYREHLRRDQRNQVDFAWQGKQALPWLARYGNSS